jgi:hypothetical protein
MNRSEWSQRRRWGTGVLLFVWVGLFGPSLTANVAVAYAAGAAPGAASELQREQAQARFARAKPLFDAGDFAEALREFRASIEIVNSPNARLYVARCLEQTGDLVDAYVEFGRAALEARESSRADGRYSLTATEAETERAAVAPKLGFVKLSVLRPDAGTTVRVEGQELPHEAWSEPIPVKPGHAELQAESPGRAPVRATVSVAQGETKAVSLDAGAGIPLAAADTASSRRGGSVARPFAYAATAIGVAGLAVFIVEGLEAKATHDDLESACHGPCPNASFSSQITSGTREQTIADAGLAVGASALAAAAVLFVVSLPKSGASESRVGVFLSPRGVTVGGAL